MQTSDKPRTLYQIIMGALASAIAASVVVPAQTQAQELEPPVFRPPTVNPGNIIVPVIPFPRPNEGPYFKEYYQHQKDGYTKELPDQPGSPLPWFRL
jgi:hypothetical protein